MNFWQLSDLAQSLTEVAYLRDSFLCKKRPRSARFKANSGLYPVEVTSWEAIQSVPPSLCSTLVGEGCARKNAPRARRVPVTL